jgi:hypothetical protein
MDSLKNRYGEFSILRASGLMGSAERRNRLASGTQHATLPPKNDE